MNNLVLCIIVIVYLFIVLGLGYLGYKRTKSTKDYLIAGGQTHPVLMALAYGATFISTSAIVGFGGTAALFGMGLLWLTFLNIFVGIFIAFVVYGKRTAVIGKELGVNTFPELLGKRFSSPFMQKFSAVIIFVTMPLYAAAVMIGAVRFMELVIDIPYVWAVLIFAVIVAAYVIAGGLKGVLYTDAFQGTIMFVAMITLLVFTYTKLGGVSAAHQSLTSLTGLVPESLKASGHQGWTSMPAFGSEYWLTLVTTIVLGVGIGVLAQPQLVVRYLTVKGPRELNRAVIAGGIFILGMTGIVFVVGALTNVYFVETMGKISLLAAVDPATGQPNIDTIIPLYIGTAMPPWFSYIFMLTLLSAAMSTLSGQFHVIGSSFSYDIYKKNDLTISRCGIVVALIITLYLTLKLPVSIVAVATALFFGICAASFLPAYTAALFWPRATKAGAIASMVSGFAVSILLMVFVHAKESTALGICMYLFGKPYLLPFPWNFLDPIVISLPLSALVLVTVSLLTQPASVLIPSCLKAGR
ncbi:sodium:solute symporter family protein [Desulfofalx alkaliphila]|uniref:sodium:solute symporter family protein n=1 Tax=Desulfofalx alkaliphila TaxID=105483 RepID=UPI0004E1F60E|nr:sodium:solute symporter family protein [Desulfofalx alkaliphila]